MNSGILAQILAEILVDNSGNRLTHALSTGIVSAFAQSVAKIPPEVINPPADVPSAALSDPA